MSAWKEKKHIRSLSPFPDERPTGDGRTKSRNLAVAVFNTINATRNTTHEIRLEFQRDFLVQVPKDEPHLVNDAYRATAD